MRNLPDLMDRDTPIFVISVAAHLSGMHPQTLRQYDRLGLVSPKRARGRGRRYSMADISRLRLVQRLSQDEGINLPGIRRILEMNQLVEDQQREIERLREALTSALAAKTGPRLFTATEAGDVRLGHTRRAIAALTRS